MTSLSLLRIWLIILLAVSLPFSCLASEPEHMAPQHAKELQKWLDENGKYRLATIEDCECMDDVMQKRRGDGGVWKPLPNYEPHYAVGDFNGDGIKDFAVMVRPIATPKGALVLVFLGATDGNVSAPIKRSIPDDNIVSYGLFVDRSNKKFARLIVGLFASEGEEVKIRHVSK